MHRVSAQLLIPARPADSPAHIVVESAGLHNFDFEPGDPGWNYSFGWCPARPSTGMQTFLVTQYVFSCCEATKIFVTCQGQHRNFGSWRKCEGFCWCHCHWLFNRCLKRASRFARLINNENLEAAGLTLLRRFRRWQFLAIICPGHKDEARSQSGSSSPRLIKKSDAVIGAYTQPH